MTLIEEHLVRPIVQFVQAPDAGFQLVFDELQHPKKENAKQLLVYVDKIVNLATKSRDEGITYAHLHFEGLAEDWTTVVAEFIVAKFFYLSLLDDVIGDNFILG